LVEFLGGFSFSSSFSLVVLASWVGCLLLDILLGLSLFLIVGFIYQVVVQSLHFHFLYIENTKNNTFCIMAFYLLGSYY
jgi:hypothetical protein